MRVSGGKAKGHRLNVPSAVSDLRPSQDQVREAIFNILSDWIVGKDVLDLFAGTGSLGIEALSRGARTADFVDKSHDACDMIKRNINHTYLQGKSDIFESDVFKFLNSPHHQLYDLIFLDPPYAHTPRDEIMKIPQFLKDNGVLIYLHGNKIIMENKEDRALIGDKLELFDTRRYGRTFVSFLRKTKNKDRVA